MSILDDAVVAELEQALPGFLGELVRDFEQAVPEMLSRVRAASLSSDAGELRRAVHSLRGSAATLGARALAAQCAELETLAARGSVGDAGARVGAIEAACTEALAALRARAGAPNGDGRAA